MLCGFGKGERSFERDHEPALTRLSNEKDLNVFRLEPSIRFEFKEMVLLNKLL